MWLGLSTLAWVAILLAVWTVTALLAALLLGRLLRLSRERDSEHNQRVLAENDVRKLTESPDPVYTSPRGRHHPDTSQFPAVRADPAEAVSTGPMPQVPGAWTEEIHPGRRAEDRGVPPPPPRSPGQPTGRRRSDAPRQTRTAARRLRDGDDEDPASAS